jgi:hypothetical protein
MEMAANDVYHLLMRMTVTHSLPAGLHEMADQHHLIAPYEHLAREAWFWK